MRTAVVILMFALALAGCTNSVTFSIAIDVLNRRADADTPAAPRIAPGANRLGPEDMRIYRAVWGEWLESHPYRPRPVPEQLDYQVPGGETWHLIARSRPL